MVTKASRPKPLDDIVVVDFSSLLPGPMCSLLLAEAGAKVIKIERPGQGDEMRGYEPAAGSDSANFILLNRGKTSISLDLKSANDKQTALSLIEKADVLIEQFRPGVMERLGLSYEITKALNPGIIYCSISGYGQSGPARDLAAHDLNYMARSGLLSLSGDEHGQPGLPCALIADIAAGAYPAMMNILLALQQRAKTGHGAWLDIAMGDNLLPMLYWALGEGELTGPSQRWVRAWSAVARHVIKSIAHQMIDICRSRPLRSDSGRSSATRSIYRCPIATMQVIPSAVEKPLQSGSPRCL